jgi:tetraacyldisaccharide 4'-kinase
VKYPIDDRRGSQTMEREGNAWERVASWGYGAAVRAFHAAHDANWLSTRRAPCLVVSIGALTAGGAGKTPVVRWLAERLVERGRSPAILTRGYRSSGGSASRVVDARTPDAWRDGDEPVLLARSLPGVPVIVGPDRVRSATLAKTTGADVLLLDAGFQHRRLVRDVDVLLWDRTAADAHGRLLPAGPLREPARGARRADIVLLVDRGDGVPDPPKHAIAPYRFPILLRTHARQAIPDGTPVHAVSGIANPAAFERALVDLGLVVTSATRFPDHHRFTLDDVHRCAQTARRQHAAVLAVTAKDYVRWPKSESAGVPAVFDLDVDVESEDLLLSAILDEGIGTES